MPSEKRKRSKNTEKVAESNRGDKIIRLPISVQEYEKLSKDVVQFRVKLEELHRLYPEIFPTNFALGYEFHDKRLSKKQGVSHRRIALRDGSIYALYSHVWMPYMSGKSADSWYALLLIFFGVPFWVIVLGFGKNEMHWYRQFKHLGRFSLVGTSIKEVSKFPKSVAVDEKFTWLRGQQVYVAMVAGLNCLLGISLSLKSDEASLTEAYGTFKADIVRFKPNFELKSFVADGWSATNNAIKNLFSTAVGILCFLHSVIKIRNVATKEVHKKELFDKVWQVYQQENTIDFSAKINDLKQWANQNIEKESVKEQINKMQNKSNLFQSYYACKSENLVPLRTSNMVDRTMKTLDRFLFNHQYFHGHLATAQTFLKAFAILYNFVPFAPRTIRDKPTYLASRMANINGFQYKENWLDNLLIAASGNGKFAPPPN
jgi:hypothetical protein